MFQRVRHVPQRWFHGWVSPSERREETLGENSFLAKMTMKVTDP